MYEEDEVGVGVGVVLEFEGERPEADFDPPALVVAWDVGDVGKDFADLPAFPPIDNGLSKFVDRRRSSLDGVDEVKGADDVNEDVEEEGEEVLKEKSNELIIDISQSPNSLEISTS